MTPYESPCYKYLPSSMRTGWSKRSWSTDGCVVPAWWIWCQELHGKKFGKEIWFCSFKQPGFILARVTSDFCPQDHIKRKKLYDLEFRKWNHVLQGHLNDMIADLSWQRNRKRGKRGWGMATTHWGDASYITALFKAIWNREKVKHQLCVMFVRHMTGSRNCCQWEDMGGMRSSLFDLIT